MFTGGVRAEPAHADPKLPNAGAPIPIRLPEKREGPGAREQGGSLIDESARRTLRPDSEGIFAQRS